MRKYAGENETRNIPDLLAKYKGYDYSSNDQRNAELIGTMQTELTEIRETCLGYRDKFRDFDATVAGRFCVASAELHFAKFLSDYPTPDFGDNINAEIVFQEQLDTLITPLEDGSIAGLEQVIELSKKQELWTTWTTLALEELNSYDPKSYPPEKSEERFQTPSKYVPTVGPISVKPPAGIVPVDVEAPPEVIETPEVDNVEVIPENVEDQQPEDEMENTEDEMPSWGPTETEDESSDEGEE
jgi:hypothetical protein